MKSTGKERLREGSAPGSPAWKEGSGEAQRSIVLGPRAARDLAPRAHHDPLSPERDPWIPAEYRAAWEEAGDQGPAGQRGRPVRKRGGGRTAVEGGENSPVLSWLSPGTHQAGSSCQLCPGRAVFQMTSHRVGKHVLEGRGTRREADPTVAGVRHRAASSRLCTRCARL